MSKKPSQYPPLAFHSIRLGQWISSLYVAIVIFFFIHHLHKEHFPVPWTFLLLLTVSILTLVALTATTLLHFTRSLNPKLNLTVNGTLTVLWVLALALLTWNLTWTLGHRCIVTRWHNEAGIMVCRLYKSVTAFTVTGAFTTILALVLDMRIQRNSTQLGKYNPMLDVKGPTNVRSSSPFGASVANLNEQEEGVVPEIRVKGPSHDLQRPYKVQKPIEAGRFGYSQPEEQTSYGGGGDSGDIADRYD